MSRRQKRWGKWAKPGGPSVAGDAINAVKGRDEGYTVPRSNQDKSDTPGFEPSKEGHKRSRRRRKKHVMESKNGGSLPADVDENVIDLHVTKGLNEGYTEPTSNQDVSENSEVCEKKSLERRKNQNTSSTNNQDILSGLGSEPSKECHKKRGGRNKEHDLGSKKDGNAPADVDENVNVMHVTKGNLGIKGTRGKRDKHSKMRKVEEQLQAKESVQVIAKGDEHSHGYLEGEAEEEFVGEKILKEEVKLDGEAELQENEVYSGKVQTEGETQNEGLDHGYVIRRAKLFLHVASSSTDQNDSFCDSCKESDLSVGLLSPKRSNRKLLVLDLNGLLADIVPNPPPDYKADKKVNRKAVFKRPFCEDFLQFCFEKFDVAVWSSRRKDNVDMVVDCLMGDLKNKLLFCWDQSKCTTTGFHTVENRHKPLVLKELKKVWDKEEPGLPWEKGYYNPSNTLLLDDSPYKALCNPAYTAVFPSSYTFTDENDSGLGPGGDLRVYLEGLVDVEDVRHYVEGHPFGQRPITNANPSWPFYLHIIELLNSTILN